MITVVPFSLRRNPTIRDRSAGSLFLNLFGAAKVDVIAPGDTKTLSHGVNSTVRRLSLTASFHPHPAGIAAPLTAIMSASKSKEQRAKSEEQRACRGVESHE